MALEINLNGENISFDPDEDFFIDEGNIDGELCKAGRLLSFYGTLAADLKAQSATLKSDLEAFDAELSLIIRETSKQNNEKITEGGIKEKVLTNEQRRVKSKEYIKAEQYFQKIENLYRSQQKKTDCVIALAYKQRTEIAKINYS